MKVPICKCCGHPIVSDEIGVVLTPQQRRIFNVVKQAGSAGISGPSIMDAIYANAINGGAESSSIIAVVVRNANRRLEQFSIRIRGKRGHGGFYAIEKISKKEGAHERAASGA